VITAAANAIVVRGSSCVYNEAMYNVQTLCHYGYSIEVIILQVVLTIAGLDVDVISLS
jgi:hypothetical protein